jgi:threonine/homoserine/homoserine lactone efflux protein
MTHVAAFLAVSAVVIVTPGQDTALTIRNSLLGGRPGGIATAFGVALGQATWAVAAAAGVAALLRASEPAFMALKLAGAAYLVLLGLRSLVDVFRGRAHTADDRAQVSRLRPGTAWRQGVVSNLGNPKMAIFFTSLLPQFASSFAALLALGLVFATMTLTWLTGYAIVVSKAGDVLRRSRIRRALDTVTGAVLVALGLRLAAER